jgi:hypothetical protein
LVEAHPGVELAQLQQQAHSFAVPEQMLFEAVDGGGVEAGLAEQVCLQQPRRLRVELLVGQADR